MAGGRGVAIGLGLAGAAAIGLGAAYFLTRSSGPKLLVNGQTGPVPVAGGSNVDIEVSGGTPGDPVRVLYSVDRNPSDAFSPTGGVGTFDARGNFSVPAAYLYDTGAPFTFYAAAIDTRTGQVGNWVAIKLSTGGAPPGSGGGTPPPDCVTPNFPCYFNETLTACCPPGDLCADPSAGCPHGSTSDPTNAGCCLKTAPLVVPASWNAPTNLVAYGRYCQPVSLQWDFSWTCSGQPKLTAAGISFSLQLIGTDGNPMTGVQVQATVKAGSGTNGSLDKSIYTTDRNGYIYPVATGTLPGTTCDPPGGPSSVDNGSVTFEFYPVNTPTQSPPIADVTVDFVYDTSYVNAATQAC